MRRIAIYAAVSVLLVAAAPAQGALLAGAGKESIVPPFPMHMGGFGDRLDYFTGVHDEIYVRALYAGDGETQLVIIGSDLMNLDVDLTRAIRERVESKTGIPGANVMVSSVHNHSAPSYYQAKTDDEKTKCRDFMAERFAAAAIAAYESRVPAKAGYANGEIRGATSNRQQGNEEVIDPQVGVLRVEKAEGREVIAILFNFTGHPVILGSGNLELSGEYPGAASRTVEHVLGGVAIFTQGAAGDITVKREGDPWLEIARLGRLVAGEVIKTAESIRPGAAARLMAAGEEITLAQKPLPPVEEAREQLERARHDRERADRAGLPREIMRQHEQRIRMFEAVLNQAEGLAAGTLERPESYEASVQVFQIGSAIFAAVPGELFVEYALEMRQRTLQSTGKSFCLVGYANGYVGYIVTPRAVATGGYEASVARVHPDSGRILTERIMRIVLENVR